jgi:hypothetical protein
MFNRKNTKENKMLKLIERFPFKIKARKLVHKLPSTIEIQLDMEPNDFCNFVNFMFNHIKYYQK